MKIVLKTEFKEKYHLQIQGTAMRTKVAPAYTNLFMGKLEETVIHLGKPHIPVWKSFIDNIFLMKFTHEINLNQLTFLDITLCKGNRFNKASTLDNVICTHIKPTNTQTTLYPLRLHITHNP